MKKICLGLSLIVMLSGVLAGCGGAREAAAPETSGTASTASSDSAGEEKATRTIQYLDNTYTIPADPQTIVITGSMESMEDSLVLDVKPAGAISVGGAFPEMFASITSEAKSVGEKMQPNMEAILAMKPDVILGSSKFPPEVTEKLGKIATTFPVSHISTNWEANLLLLGELTGKQKEAEQIINDYKTEAAAAKEQLGEQLKEKKVVVVRIREGNLYIYPETVFFNPVLYADLGLTAPAEVKAAKAQENISLEKFSEMDPDYLFVQFSPDENRDNPQALEDLQNNPIWQSLKAVKNGKVFVNVVDPLAQGGTAWSKVRFLKAAVEKLSAE
jgi:iron complex transport system substrate-binding protein